MAQLVLTKKNVRKAVLLLPYNSRHLARFHKQAVFPMCEGNFGTKCSATLHSHTELKAVTTVGAQGSSLH